MVENLSMKTVIGATEVRNNLGTLLNRVYRGEEHLVVEKLGIPVAAIINIKEYEAFRRWWAAKLHQRLGRRLGAKAAQMNLTEDQLMERMEKDRADVYTELYGNQA